MVMDDCKATCMIGNWHYMCSLSEGHAGDHNQGSRQWPRTIEEVVAVMTADFESQFAKANARIDALKDAVLELSATLGKMGK
jgi:Mor family transcriptional regulator